MEKIAVLMSTYNGEKYLIEQIESVLNQKGIEVHLFVRDDGSSDNTKQILENYKNQSALQVEYGENLGYGKSFFKLVSDIDNFDYYAFCDQDDVWDNDKLIIAVKKIQECPENMPVLYYSALRTVDKNLKFLRNQFDNYEIPLSNALEEALLYSHAYGCTCVFNKKTRALLTKYEMDNFYAHDLNINMVASGLGYTIFDKEPHLSYRQHEGNCFGFPWSSWKNLKKAVKFYKEVESKNMRLKEIDKFKNLFYSLLSEKNKNFVDMVSNYKINKIAKKNLLKNKDIRRKSGITNLYFRYLIKTNKF